MTKTYLNANRYMFLFKFTDITLVFSMPKPLSTSVHLIGEWGLDGDISWLLPKCMRLRRLYDNHENFESQCLSSE